jgi:hypothetical protein
LLGGVRTARYSGEQDWLQKKPLTFVNGLVYLALK